MGASFIYTAGKVNYNGETPKYYLGGPFTSYDLSKSTALFAMGRVSRPCAEKVVPASSLELAMAKWNVALHDGRRDQPAVHAVTQPQSASRLQAVLSLIEQHRQKWALPADLRIVVSYEAGQHAFWIYRALQARGIECYLIDPASLPAERQKQRAKTDRLDASRLVINLHASGIRQNVLPH
ncbi:hypothetical protein OKW40_005739 [Paraburkholderia sp. RAU6.4a]